MSEMSYPVRYFLGLLVEEMGEALQLIGKALRFGIDTPGVKRLDGSIDMEATPRSMLPRELGDVRAGIYLAEFGMLDDSSPHYRAKLARLLDRTAKDNLGRPLAPDPVLASPEADEHLTRQALEQGSAE